MIKYYLFILMFGCVLAGTAQDLITNGDFEKSTQCPSGYGEINYVKYWMPVQGHQGTPDYLSNCHHNTPNCTDSYFGGQEPASGIAYIGLLFFHSSSRNMREYVQIRLTNALTAGQIYTITMKVSLAEISNFASIGPQFYFSKNPINVPANDQPIKAVVPQVAIEEVITDVTGWTTVSVNYTATGGEQFMVMGNFQSDGELQKKKVPTGTDDQIYYFIDDVSLTSAQPIEENLLSFTCDCTAGGNTLEWSTATETDIDSFYVEYSTDGTVYTTDFSMDAVGNSTSAQNYTYTAISHSTSKTWYRLNQVDINGVIKQFTPIEVNCTGN